MLSLNSNSETFYAAFSPHYIAGTLADITDNLASLTEKFVKIEGTGTYYIDANENYYLAFDDKGRFVLIESLLKVTAEAIPDPTGGETVDTENRAATAAILALLRLNGFIPTE